MRITVREDYLIELTDVYNPIVFKTKDDVEYFICMRDDGIEVTEKSIGTLRIKPNEQKQTN